MVETKVPKDIRKYKTKVLGPFTLRQLLTLILGGLVDLLVYNFFLKDTSLDISVTIVILTVVFGLIYITSFDFDGITVETYIKSVIIPQFKSPKKRKYSSTSTKKVKKAKPFKTKKQIEEKEKALQKIYREHPDLEPFDRKVLQNARNKKK